jgi:hypothetical protein
MVLYSKYPDLDYDEDDDSMPTESHNEVLFPLQRLRVAGFRIYLSPNWPNIITETTKHHDAAEELRLERLAMGEGYHPTKEELECRISYARGIRSHRLQWRNKGASISNGLARSPVNKRKTRRKINSTMK